MRGIILAGGSRTPLHAMTLGESTQRASGHDTPMIRYPLSTTSMLG
jgi:dTDP-glucose pyrophosphorylase